MASSVLVVEDDTSAAESIRDALVAAGYDVTATVASGMRALEVATRERPSLVLMDVQLDGPIDGIETAERLRAEMDIPVVYLTSFVDPETLRRAKQTAPHGYLRKPFGPRELSIAVELALHQHALERVAAARERWFANTLLSIADAVVTVDAEQRLAYVNLAAERLLGRERPMLVGRPLGEVVRLVVDGKAQALDELVGRAIRDRAITPLPSDARLEGAAEAPPTFVEGSVSPMVSSEPDERGAAIVLRDVGERRRLERRLLATERLAAVGTMAAGMRHEINNPLAVVVANLGHALTVLRERGAVEADLVAALEDAAHGADRVRTIVDGLRPIAQGDEGRRQSCPTQVLVADAARASAHALRHHALLELAVDRAPELVCDRDRMVAALVALLLGAAARVGEGRAAENVIRLSARGDAEGRVVFEVHDDGAPLDEAARARMFDPFVASGNATTAGVELAVAQRTILAHGGEIEVLSRPGAGTTVRFTVPVSAAATASRNAAPAAADAPRPSTAAPATPEGRQARVLVVDDEPAIGRAIARMLALRHDVSVESDARIALARIAGGETFDVVLCDLMMPLMSGMDFYEQLGRHATDLRDRVIFLTGGAFTPRSEQFLRDVKNPCLTKPFARGAVAEAVDQLLGTARS